MKRDLLNICQLLGQRIAEVTSALILLILVASPAYAHKVHIFAYVDGDLIKTESRFNGGRPARSCAITVHTLSGQDIAASGTSDDKGLFQFPVAELTGDLDIIITCGDGHRGSWHLEEDDYLLAGAEPVTHVHAELPAVVAQSEDTDDDLLRKIIAEEVEKKLAPLRRELTRLAERRTSLQDILGGIGYLFGLAGLAAYMKYKKST
ncbi:MAG: hypothetical protein ABFS09_02090 [Thermodesulfobacteriota bacterium]